MFKGKKMTKLKTLIILSPKIKVNFPIRVPKKIEDVIVESSKLFSLEKTQIVYLVNQIYQIKRVNNKKEEKTNQKTKEFLINNFLKITTFLILQNVI
jgi:hypothetical protein